MKRDEYLLFGCAVAIATTSFGFISRAFLIADWRQLFDLSETQIGSLQGAGLYPFALSIILFSLVIDRLGYGRVLAIAWVGHIVSALITMTATDYTQLYLGTLTFALANGAVEAAVNPIVASLYPRSKTHHLNLLHAGWPGGLVVGGLLAIALGDLEWRWKIGLFLLPAIVYGAMLAGRSFPVQERVAAGISYRDMLREFGWGACMIVSFFVARAVDETLRLTGAGLSNSAILALTLIPTVAFATVIRSFGRPLFVFLLLLMIPLSTTELGTDSWVAALVTPMLANLGEHAGNWVLVYTAAIMFVLRLFAGHMMHRSSPLGLLAGGSALAALGLVILSQSHAAVSLILLAATLYGVGKAYFWPTTLGLVADQSPKGGALTLNAVSGMGMIAVGVLGNPLVGTLQDHYLDKSLQRQSPAIHAAVVEPPQTKFGITFQSLSSARISKLSEDERSIVEHLRTQNSYATLAKVAILPTIMLCCYLGLLVQSRARGGYQPKTLNPLAGRSGGP